MQQRNRADDQAATESKFYLPVGYSPSYVVGRLEELRAKLFNHRVDPST